MIASVAALILLALGGTVAALWWRGNAQDDLTGLIFAEFSARSDTIFVAPPDDPAKRTTIATVEHAEGWGLNPAIAPAGSKVAYTVPPPGSRPQADSPAELWLLDVRTKARQRIAGDADLRVAPVFDRNGSVLIYRSSTAGGQQALVRVDVASSTRKPVVSVETTFGIFPIGFASDGALLYASISQQGTDIVRAVDGQPPTPLFRASDQVTRDWRLSPDGSMLAYLAPEVTAERVVHRLHVVRIEGVRVTPVPAAAAVPTSTDQYGAAWASDGSAVTVGREAAPDPRAGAIVVPLNGGQPVALAAPPRGFDRPLMWSADGKALVVHSFDGATANAPGTESTAVITSDGQRRVVTGSGDIIVFGWLSDA